jgi:hypothetical protein
MLKAYGLGPTGNFAYDAFPISYSGALNQVFQTQRDRFSPLSLVIRKNERKKIFFFFKEKYTHEFASAIREPSNSRKIYK